MKPQDRILPFILPFIPRNIIVMVDGPKPLTERFGELNLVLGGKNGYVGVRGKQGPNEDQFQGYTPKKVHTTKLYDTAHEAAIYLAILKRDLPYESEEDENEKKPARKPRTKKVFCQRHASALACDNMLTECG